jgi:hypothetical protein
MINQLQSFLKDAQNQLGTLKDITNPEDRKTRIIGISEACLRILDYIINNYIIDHFPEILKEFERKHRKIYFPRPRLGESSEKYFARVRTEFGIKRTDELFKFIRKAYDIVCKYQKAVTHIESKTKHVAPPDITGKELKNKLDYSVRSLSGQNPVSLTEDGLDIGGFIKVGKGSSVSIAGSSFVSDKQAFIVDHLEYGFDEILGNEIIMKDGTKMEVALWLEYCVKTCEEMINIFQGLC